MDAATRDHIRRVVSERQLRCLAADKAILKEAKANRREAKKEAERTIRRCRRKKIPIPGDVAAQVPDVEAV